MERPTAKDYKQKQRRRDIVNEESSKEHKLNLKCERWQDSGFEPYRKAIRQLRKRNKNFFTSPDDAVKNFINSEATRLKRQKEATFSNRVLTRLKRQKRNKSTSTAPLEMQK